MNRFLNDAQQILEAAEMAADPDVSILIHGRGIHVVTGKSDWPLASLLAESGATAAYRVSRTGGQVLVEGRSNSETCVLRRKPAQDIVRELLPDRRNYAVVNGIQCGNEARMLLT